MARYGFILGVICMTASGLLAGVNSLTSARIAAQAREEHKKSLKEVMPQAEQFEAVKYGEDTIYYKAYDNNRNLVGFVFNAQAKGYSSQIETMVGLDRALAVTAVKILSQNETPGLGTRISGPDFLGRFAKRNIQNLSDIQAISGATISSKAVINMIQKKTQEAQVLIKNER